MSAYLTPKDLEDWDRLFATIMKENGRSPWEAENSLLDVLSRLQDSLSAKLPSIPFHDLEAKTTLEENLRVFWQRDDPRGKKLLAEQRGTQDEIMKYRWRRIANILQWIQDSASGSNAEMDVSARYLTVAHMLGAIETWAAMKQRSWQPYRADKSWFDDESDDHDMGRDHDDGASDTTADSRHSSQGIRAPRNENIVEVSYSQTPERAKSWIEDSGRTARESRNARPSSGVSPFDYASWASYELARNSAWTAIDMGKFDPNGGSFENSYLNN